MKKTILALAFTLIAIASSAQTKSAFLEAAEKAYENKNYYAALTYFNEVLEFDGSDINALVKSAESARKFNSYQLAIDKYTMLLDSLDYDQDSTMYVHLADMYQRVGDYNLANEYYDLYITEYGEEGNEMTEHAKRNKESVVYAAARASEVDTSYNLQKMGDDVNGSGSDFGPNLKEDVLYFTSMGFEVKDPVTKERKSISKIMYREDEGSAAPLPFEINNRDNLVANIAFSRDGKRAYYTVCDYINENDVRCDLYTSMIDGEGNLFNERKLPSPINQDSTTSTQPTIRYDAENDEEIMYFVSDREGGEGGLDLYSTVISGESGYSDPKNVSELNTQGDDLTPFFHQATNTLYFSTDGRRGLGGYDIHMSRLSNGLFQPPSSLPAPVNSSYHDAFYFLNEDEDKAYMATNREGATYVDKELKSCCYDIYEIDINPVMLELNALTFDKLSLLELEGATVRVVDKLTGKIIGEITPEDSHEHLFEVLRNREYQVVGSKPNFISDTIDVSTVGKEEGDLIEEKLYLTPDGISLEVLTFDESTKEDLIGVTVTIEDLSDPANTRQVKLNDKGNNFDFLIEPGKSYRITAEKSRFNTVTEILDTRGMSGKITKKMFLPRFDLAAYLPIALFFDNDEPDPDSKSTYTDKKYDDLLDAYMQRKPTFKSEYTKKLSAAETVESDQNMENFFEGNVKGGYDQFKIFMDGLLQELQAGARINLTVRGYASPRFDIRYNLVLAQRRIQSVKNEMMSYKGGVLSKYISQKQLILTEISLGEELAPSDVSDNLYDEQGSIYSIKASKQRRIEIISIKSN